MRLQTAERELRRRIEATLVQRTHPLDKKLIVSLTSYEARFPTLSKTLLCLLNQTMKPDMVVLWVAREQMASLPPDVIELRSAGLVIEPVEDTRSYKKLIPALQRFPESVIVTADDDVYYWGTWLEELVEAHLSSGNPVVCHRAHKITFCDGEIASYGDWDHAVSRREASDRIFPTGVHGILYDSACFHRDVLERDLYQALCPHGDDIWFYWMHRLMGSAPLVLGMRRRIVEWPDTQAQQLQSVNIRDGGNDRAVRAMVEHYGALRFN
ncbi:hypothetical protein IP76_07845 [Rhizobium sp. AAP43]|nr:hypothetical protein IP76_07845 [Rhizobium sp. AAP43]